MELLSGYGKGGVNLGLLSKPSDITDSEFLSKYFVLQEFFPEFTAGKNVVTFNGSEYLKKGSEVFVECVDSVGNSLYIESTTKTNPIYKESSNHILSIHVYAETSNGLGKLILYGTLTNGDTVKWVGNIVIDKNKPNVSSVRFYKKPVLEVVPILSPIISYVGDLNREVELTGSFYSFAANPPKDSLKINIRNKDVDYRIYFKNFNENLDPQYVFNSQLENISVDFYIRTIQEPYSYRNLDVNFTTSIDVKKVINNSTIILKNPIFYKDVSKKEIVVNVVDGDFYVKYPYLTYNTASESQSYLITNVSDGQIFIKQSQADIIYRNLRTFSGFIARHKVYRKSLFSSGDFEVIADEPLSSYELLKDKLTTNKSFDKMGWFYNQRHINKYWFTGSNNISLLHSPNQLIDSVNIKVNVPHINCNSLENYILVKDNTSDILRSGEYIPYQLQEFTSTSGSSYDCNFLELKKDVNYIVFLNAIIRKDVTSQFESDSGLEFYFTSSVSGINSDPNSVKIQPGLLKLGKIYASEPKNEIYYTNTSFTFTPTVDLYGTLVIVPRKCSAVISELSLKPYGDVGYSPDTLITRIPFPVNIPNESFEIKSELFDINSNLVYSDLRTISSFDVSGSSLTLFIPGLKDPNKTKFLSGSLDISMSLWVGENLYVTGSLQLEGALQLDGIVESPYQRDRLLSWDYSTKKVYWTNIKGIDNTGTETVNVSLYEKPGNSDGSSVSNPVTYRLIPSVPGRNVAVLKSTFRPGGGSEI